MIISISLLHRRVLRTWSVHPAWGAQSRWPQAQALTCTRGGLVPSKQGDPAAL